MFIGIKVIKTVNSPVTYSPVIIHRERKLKAAFVQESVQTDYGRYV
jgi:hypothetical protein